MRFCFNGACFTKAAYLALSTWNIVGVVFIYKLAGVVMTCSFSSQDRGFESRLEIYVCILRN